jgi:hypothetical protein
MPPKNLIVNFNGDNVPYIARPLELTGLRAFYLIDGECETIEYIKENFTILGEA